MSHAAKTPRVLLLGAHGQLGHELRRRLAQDFQLTCTARHGDAETVALDVTRPDAVRATVREVRPNLIVNAAAYTLVDQAEKEPDAATAVNGTLPGILQEEANRLGAALVHYSTDYVFDGSGTRPWTETDPTGPLGAYGRSKLLGEENIAAVGGPALVLRTSWVFGAHGTNFVKKILKYAREREKLRIVADQVGGPTSAHYLAELTATILAAADGDFAGLFRERGGLFHACNAGFTSWHEFTVAIAAEARRAGLELKVAEIEPIPSSEFPTPARRPLNSRLNCSRLEREYRHVAPSWQVALAETMPSLLKAEFGVGS